MGNRFYERIIRLFIVEIETYQQYRLDFKSSNFLYYQNS